jgi:hypothetical protein
MATSSLESGLKLRSAVIDVRPVNPISAIRLVGHRTVVIESLAAAVIVLAAMMVLSPSDGGVRRLGPHFAWIAVFLLSARYGTKGLCVSLSLSIALVIASAGILGQMHALGERLNGSADLAALVAAVLIAWVASTHENRRSDMARELDAAKEGSRSDRKAAREMQGALVALRSRADRMSLSLTFLRTVAEHLGGKNPEQAISAALTLAMTCLGARAGVVEIAGSIPGAGFDITPSLSSWTGPWNGDGSAPLLAGDRVVAAALEARMPVIAADVDGAGVGDADMVAPLLDRNGKPFGVLALRGLPHRGVGMMAIRDLTVASSWLASSLTPPLQLNAAPAKVIAKDELKELPYLDFTLSSELDRTSRRLIEVRA